MKVTIVDSEPAVVGLIDCLDHLPSQPPSLYMDIEGVRLSRHGSISVIQLLVFPQEHIYLIDVFHLKEAAFSTANDSGISLRSVLESAQVPKVFFDVRNDSDALFAHFQISLQGVHDVQLLELATCPYLRERVHGLGVCIERDAQLPPKELALWKASKHQGLLHFAPEHGGFHEVFNCRPMLQDIIDYCTQDVVYLPVLWRVYTRKLSAKWMKKVMHESRERIVASQQASYEPHGREKVLSPWAKSANSARENQRGGTGAGRPERNTVTAIAKLGATEATRKSAVPQPDKKTDLEPSAGEAGLRRSARLAARRASKDTTGLEVSLSKLDLSMRSKKELVQGSKKKMNATVYCAPVSSRWTCVICSREMQQDQKEEHIAGKQHIARVKQNSALQTSIPKNEPLGMMTVTRMEPQMGDSAAKAMPRKSTRGPSKDPGTNSKKGQVRVLQSQERGLPYPPDHLFHGFQGGAGPGIHQYETSWFVDAMDYNACDKDCGWCGRCMDGVDS